MYEKIKPIVKRVAVIVLVAFFSLSINGIAALQVREKAKGQYFSVNGYSLYIRNQGHELGKPKPLVIMEAGLGESSSAWNKVLPLVAKFAHVVTYDREGRGKSEADIHSESAQTAQQAANNLKILLGRTGVKPPYVLVGDSIGGLYLQYFAEENPRDVCGMVLINSLTRHDTAANVKPTHAVAHKEARSIGPSAQQIEAAQPFPNIPLIVLTTESKDKELFAKQQWLAKLSKQGQLIIISGTEGNVLQTKAEVIANNIQKIASQCKNYAVRRGDERVSEP